GGTQLLDELDKPPEDHPELIKARAAIAIASGHPQEAEARLAQLTRQLPADALAALLLGWAQFRGGRPKNAETTFQTPLRLDPKLAAAAYGVALCRERAGDDTGVQTWMQNTLKASPSHFAAGLATTRDKGEDSIQGLIQLSGGKASPPELAQAW